MMVVTAQYRSPLSFTEETFKAAKNSLKRVEKCTTNLRRITSKGSDVVGEDTNRFYITITLIIYIVKV